MGWTEDKCVKMSSAQGWACCPVVKCLPRMHKPPTSVPSRRRRSKAWCLQCYPISCNWMADTWSFFPVFIAPGTEKRESSEPTGNLRAILILPWSFIDLDGFHHRSSFQIHQILSSPNDWWYLGRTFINSQLFHCSDLGVLSFVLAWPTQISNKNHLFFFEIAIFCLVWLFYPLNIIADQKKFKFFSAEHGAWPLLQSFFSLFPYWF